MTITSANFETEVSQSTKPVLLDFFAEWCGPCKVLGPILEQIGEENTDNLKIVKIDVDVSYDLATKFGISAMPTMILIKDGAEIRKNV